MSNRTNVGIGVALMTAMVLVIGQPSYAGRGHGGGGHGGGGHGSYHGAHGGYHGGGGGYGYPAYYAPAYNDYGYRGYAPYPEYSPVAEGVGAAVGSLVGGLLAPRYGHRYDY